MKLRKQNMSSPSPVTDGRRVWVMTGTGVLKSFDFNGTETWARDIQKDYGRFGLNWGYASSPLLHDGSLFIQVLHGMRTDDPSYLLRVDATTGKTLWRVERPTRAIRESPDSYATPALLKLGARAEIVVSGCAGPRFEKVAENPLEDYTLSSPAISQGQIFIRTASALWAIGPRRS